MHVEGDKVFPFTTQHMVHGECITLHFECVIRGMLDAFQLMKTAQSVGGIKLGITLDGAHLHDSTNDLKAGLKIMDQQAVDPLSGKHLSTFVIEDAIRTHCLIVKVEATAPC